MTTDDGLPPPTDPTGAAETPPPDSPYAPAGDAPPPIPPPESASREINWWLIAGIAAIIVFSLTVIAFALGASSDGGDETAASTSTTEAVTTTTPEATTTTTVDETTTTVDETTTTVEETTTTVEETTTTVVEETTTTQAPPPEDFYVADQTPVNAVLGTDIAPYGPQELFPPGSVVADWYQFEGFMVVLYRGLDLTQTGPLCPGNSVQLESAQFSAVSNSQAPPLEEGQEGGGPDDPCSGAVEVKLAEPPAGARVCGPLVYYVTEIPTDAVGTLFGTVEFIGADEVSGQTSIAATNIDQTPEFVPDQPGYVLPPSGFDDLGVVACEG